MVEVAVERMGGIAMPILGSEEQPVAAISMAALSEPITACKDALAAALEREVAACESFWNRAADKGVRRSPPRGAASQAGARR